MDCNIRIDLICESAGSGEIDDAAEFYGSFAYRAEGQSSWTTLAQTSDSSPWTLRAEIATATLEFNEVGGKGSTGMCVADQTIGGVSSSAKFIEVRGSIKEYDPSVFDADEDLGTKTVSVPIIAGSRQQRQAVQGNESDGKARWVVSVKPL